jgi:hypothetical protein
VKGEKADSVVVDVRMVRAANSWNLIEAYLKTKNQTAIPIKQKTGTPSAYFNVVPLRLLTAGNLLCFASRAMLHG